MGAIEGLRWGTTHVNMLNAGLIADGLIAREPSCEFVLNRPGPAAG